MKLDEDVDSDAIEKVFCRQQMSGPADRQLARESSTTVWVMGGMGFSRSMVRRVTGRAGA